MLMVFFYRIFILLAIEVYQWNNQNKLFLSQINIKKTLLNMINKKIDDLLEQIRKKSFT